MTAIDLESDQMPLCEVVTGSQAYQTNMPNASWDFYGVFAYANDCVEDRPSILLEGSKEEGIRKYVELKEYAKKLIEGDFQAHEVLWTGTESTRVLDPVFEMFKNRRMMFLSKEILSKWVTETHMSFGKALRVAKYANDARNIWDFLLVLSVDYTNGVKAQTLREIIDASRFNTWSAVREVLNLNNMGVTPVDRKRELYAVYLDTRAYDNVGLFEGIVKNDELNIIPTIATSMRVDFKGLIHYDREGHEQYKKVKELAKQSKTSNGYSLQSMYQAFRIIAAVRHLLKYKILSINCPILKDIKSIREGKANLLDLTTMFKELAGECLEIIPKTDYADKVDTLLINRLYNKARKDIASTYQLSK